MGTKAALIFGAAAQSDWHYLDVLRSKDLLTVCADGGLLCARNAGFTPAAFVGDCDSGGEPLQNGENYILPVRKDETDIEAAYLYACQRGCTEVYITACTGGRQDHHIAVLQLLERAYDERICATILDPHNRISCIGAGSHLVNTSGYRYFSLLPIDHQLSGVNIRHAAYPLEAAVVHRGSSLCVSNEAVDGFAEIDIQYGKGWLVLSR